MNYTSFSTLHPLLHFRIQDFKVDNSENVKHLEEVCQYSELPRGGGEPTEREGFTTATPVLSGTGLHQKKCDDVMVTSWLKLVAPKKDCSGK